MKDVDHFIVFMERGADPITNTCQPETFMGAYRYLVANNAAALLAHARRQTADGDESIVPGSFNKANPRQDPALFIPEGAEQAAYDQLVESGFIKLVPDEPDLNIPKGSEQSAFEVLVSRGFLNEDRGEVKAVADAPQTEVEPAVDSEGLPVFEPTLDPSGQPAQSDD